MEKYEKPNMELIEFTVDDVIRTSTTDGGNAGSDTGVLPWVPGTPSTTSDEF